MELTLFVDHQCNLRCSYCYNGEKFGRRMSEETMRKAVALALERPTPRLDVAFFGGEPLLRQPFLRATMEHVEHAVAARPAPRPEVRFLFNTNATLIDQQTLELMAAPRRCSVFVSLDGPRELHDACRVNAAGRGSFDEVLAGLQRLRDAAVPYHLLAVYGPDTARRLGDTLRTLLSLEPGKIQLSANLRADWNPPAIEDLRAGLHQAGQAWMEQFRAGRARWIDPLHSKILTHLQGGLPCPARCLLAAGEFTVAPSGRLYPCAQMVGEDDRDELCIGHVDRGFDRPAMARLQRTKDRVEETCAPCELRARCQSQCGCRHLGLTGQLGKITETLCDIETAMINAADAVAETLVEEKCATFIDHFYRRHWGVAQGSALTQLRRAADDHEPG